MSRENERKDATVHEPTCDKAGQPRGDFESCCRGVPAPAPREPGETAPNWMTYCGLMDDVEQAVADCAELRPDDPTLFAEKEKYAKVRAALNEFVSKLLASSAPEGGSPCHGVPHAE